MPLFYFDLTVNGHALPDPDGLLLAELHEAKFEAVVALAEMMIEAIKDGNQRSMDITIKNEERSPVARVSILIRDDLI